MKRLVACLLVLVMGSPLSMWSQSQVANPTEAQGKKLAEGDPASKAKREVQKRGAGERSRVRVTLRNQDEVKGYISQIGPSITSPLYPDLPAVKLLHGSLSRRGGHPQEFTGAWLS
jgi:hypothetical protein